MNLVNQIERLAELHRTGAITDAEFARAKDLLLSADTAQGSNSTSAAPEIQPPKGPSAPSVGVSATQQQRTSATKPAEESGGGRVLFALTATAAAILMIPYQVTTSTIIVEGSVRQTRGGGLAFTSPVRPVSTKMEVYPIWSPPENSSRSWRETMFIPERIVVQHSIDYRVYSAAILIEVGVLIALWCWATKAAPKPSPK